ncbi:hypothetical protein NECAME_01162 [Necator americanus]|uniref:Methyltransferase domain-containing protein n=1 Tax=Necator americanus TaxID=51031 RepID=W2SJX4_NECAM|nr:hypothetical protein NECAME_01162 [Necator americanus]ETN69052.1 hypothetical protein NECAME_01162 [Necator americanus]
MLTTRMMPKFGPSLMTGLSVFALTTFMFVSLRPKITILPTAPPPKSAQALPPAPKIKFVEKRLALKPNLTSPPAISKPSQRMIEFYKIQAFQRREYLKVVQQSLSKNYMFVYNNMGPEVHCPELVRVGTTNDGGKWICSPFRIPDGCAIISLGLFNEVTFEQELQYIINKRCKIFAYDSQQQAPHTLKLLESIRTKAMKATISAETDVSKQRYAIEDLMVMEGVRSIEILKIDIEVLFQIMIEIHGTPAEMVTLLTKISRQGYWLYSYEINGAWHNLCEFSFIHESAFERYGATPLAKFLDF